MSQNDAEVAGKRTIQNMEEKVNGFRKGITKKDILKEMTKDDWKRVDEVKYYQQFDKDSLTARIVLQNDTVRADRDTRIDNIKEMINNVRNVLTTNERKQEQIDTGVIVDELREGILMNKSELQFEIYSGERIVKNTVRRIVLELGNLRNLVGTRDLLNTKIMEESQYDAFVLDVEKQLKELGVELFDKEVQHIGAK